MRRFERVCNARVAHLRGGYVHTWDVGERAFSAGGAHRPWLVGQHRRAPGTPTW